MRLVVQRVSEASVTVGDKIVGQIGIGYMVLVGITHTDTEKDVAFCAKKLAGLRLFEDNEEKMNLALKEVRGAVLSISQFTLYGNCQKGNRPSFIEAARPEQAKPLYDRFNELLRIEHGLEVQQGVFGAMMDVRLLNDGPVTLLIES